MNAGAVVRRWQFCDEHGEVLSETDLEALWRDTGPCIGIERTKLQRALLPGVTDVQCQLGTEVTSWFRTVVGSRSGFPLAQPAPMTS